MRKVIIAIALLVTAAIHCSSQVTLSFTQASYTSYSINDLWGFLVMNQGASGIEAVISIALATSQGEMICRASSPGLMLSPGITSDFSLVKMQSTYAYSTSPLAETFQQSGTLPGGNYSVCIDVQHANESGVLAHECQLFQLQSTIPFFLIYPADRDTIQTVQPLLTWLPLEASQPNLSYHLRLAEMLDLQEKEEALAENNLLVNMGALTDAQLAYPNVSPPLEPGKNYAWQVDALIGTTVVAVSDAWQFHVAQMPADSANPFDCYRDIRPTINTNVYLFKNQIKIAYDNRAGEKTLKYRIINVTSGSAVGCSQEISLQNGVNKIDIDVTSCNLNRQGSYLLKVMDLNGSIYQLTFKII